MLDGMSFALAAPADAKPKKSTKAGAATAGLGGVGVVEHKALFLEGLDVVDLATAE